MVTLSSRSALSRARFFLDQAASCSTEERVAFEAFLEASIIFARAAIHRVQREYKPNPLWFGWWSGLRSDPAIEFFRKHRDWILKEAAPQIGQIIRLGDGSPLASSLYYFEGPSVPATDTVERHLNSLERTIARGIATFQAT